jgi:uncharacterized protein YndB with AHSA1/START domain
MELAAASVSRSVDLPVSAEEAWASISDEDGLAGWLGDAVDLEVAPGAIGTVAEGGVVRRTVVTAIEVGRSVELVWWDEARPEEASIVTIALAPAPDGTRVTVTERLAGAASASLGGASIGDLVGVADAAWDRRLQALVGGGALSAACV